MWDFPGGGREEDETVEECAARELQEEFGLRFNDGNVTFVKDFPAQKDPNQRAVFMVVKFPAGREKEIVLGEGQRWRLFSFEEFFADEQVIEGLKGRVRVYLEETESKINPTL